MKYLFCLIFVVKTKFMLILFLNIYFSFNLNIFFYLCFDPNPYFNIFVIHALTAWSRAKILYGFIPMCNFIVQKSIPITSHGLLAYSPLKSHDLLIHKNNNQIHIKTINL
jgi:hypothetical protein